MMLLRIGLIIVTLIGCVFVAVFASQHGGGFILYLVAPILLLWIVCGIYILRDRTAIKKTYLITLGLWLITVTGLTSLHVYYYFAARHAADAVAAAVVAYKEKVGTYPITAEAAGIELPVDGGEWRISYGVEQDRPHLFYWSTFQIFSTYSYNFDRKSWEYFQD